MKNVLQIVVTLVAAAGLVACGGGGGGSTIITPTADITTDNALGITQDVMASTATANAVGDQIGFGGFSVTASAYNDTQTLASVVANGQAYIPTAPDFVQASNAVPQVQEPCDFGGFVDVNPLSNTSVRLTFTECNGFGDGDFNLQGTLNGVMTLTVNNMEPLDISVLFAGFSISGDFVEPFSADGSIRLRIADLTGPGVFYHYRTNVGFSNFEVVLDGEPISVSFPRYDYELEEYYSDNEDWIKEDFSGSLEGDGLSFSGIANFNTVVPFKYDFSAGAYTEGELFIAGADGQEIHIVVVGDDMIDVEIDTDGDGEYDYFPQWTMDQITQVIF